MKRTTAARTLAGLLGDTATLWRPVPFYDDPLWVTTQPAAADTLLALEDSEVEALELDPAALHTLLAKIAPEIGALTTAADACLDSGRNAEAIAPLPLPETPGRDVPGRKWQQILHFAAHLGSPCGPLLEWCSGKAHLGRLLAHTHDVSVTGIEHDAALCAEGERLAKRERLAVNFLQADVLQLSAHAAHCHDNTHAIALHACGDLHVALLRTGSEAGIMAFDIAPCCYHLTQAPFWQPLSAALADSALARLSLRREELRLAVQERVTATPRVQQQSRTLAAWRLGFDVLQRQVRGIDTYLPTPTRAPSVLAAGFVAFCADLAAHHHIPLPATIDYALLEQAGHNRLRRVQRLDLLRHACRRPLEIALVADRALYLAERGYQVCISPFCPRQLTPRNLLISARRAHTYTPGGT